MKNIGIITNFDKAEAHAALQRTSDLAQTLNVHLFGPPGPYKSGLALTVVPEQELEKHIDVLLVLGGDGTMLQALHSLPGGLKPILGVNLGSLGFLTSVPLTRLEEALTAVSQHDIHIVHRITLQVQHIRENDVLSSFRALNDVVAGWGRDGRMVQFGVSINEQSSSTYSCDGLIMATPTGSTGHSLSAGGPILYPETRAMVLSAICPHTLSHRPIVLPQEARIDIEVQCSAQELLLSVDGQGQVPLKCRDRLLIEQDPRDALFVQLPDYNYFELLSRKMHWRGSAVPTN